MSLTRGAPFCLYCFDDKGLKLREVKILVHQSQNLVPNLLASKTRSREVDIGQEGHSCTTSSNGEFWAEMFLVLFLGALDLEGAPTVASLSHCVL